MISRDSHDVRQCRITLSVWVMSCMWNIDATSPSTITGPIA
nr:hypothetical protein [Propionibacterium freudenreichii]